MLKPGNPCRAFTVRSRQGGDRTHPRAAAHWLPGAVSLWFRPRVRMVRIQSRCDVCGSGSSGAGVGNHIPVAPDGPAQP